MANIKKRPTEIMTTRVPKSLFPFFKTLENRNNYVLQLIENSQEYKDYLRKKAEQEREILDIALETQETALKLKNDLEAMGNQLKIKEMDLNAEEKRLNHKEKKINDERQKIESGYPEAFNDLDKKRRQEKKGFTLSL